MRNETTHYGDGYISINKPLQTSINDQYPFGNLETPLQPSIAVQPLISATIMYLTIDTEASTP